jgi:hypothetical protein
MTDHTWAPPIFNHHANHHTLMFNLNDLVTLVLLTPVALVPIGLFVDLWCSRHDAERMFDSVHPDE